MPDSLIVLDAWTQRGWAADDHLIDDSAISGLVGRSYQSLTALRRAARRLQDPRGFAAARYRLAGHVWEVGFQPGIPGTPNPGPRQVD